MTSLVVDASTAVKWLVAEEDSLRAARLITSDAALLAPAFLQLEIANVLWKKHRRGDLTSDSLDGARAFLPVLPIRFEPLEALLQPALTLALAHGRTVYDSLYLALAIREECQLVTADERLYNAIREAFPENVALLKDFHDAAPLDEPEED